MRDDREILKISKHVFELGLVGSFETNLNFLLPRLFGVLDGLPALRIKAKGALLLFNPHGKLIPVAQYGMSHAGSAQPLDAVLEGVCPEYRETIYATRWSAQGGTPTPGRGDECFLVLPLIDNRHPLGEALIFIDSDWSPDAVELELMSDVGRVLSALVARCALNETIQVREVELERVRTEAIRRLGAASEYRERALAVMRILNQMASQYQTAIIVVTHDEKIIPTFKRIYHIRDGRTVEEAGEGRDIS